ncbi:MAG TPA: ABC transporter permease [Solirubrobacteraceae bacterium]|jgi:peptide/nickel transport system permease protein|nr:ABC transporter permease [Solirubrobacteraceae bacterium]
MKARVPRFVRLPQGAIGLGIFVFVVGVALLGPVFSPHDPNSIVGAPGSSPSAAFPFGTDYLGHDVLSQVLWGGRSTLWLGLAATALSFALGMIVGAIAGYSRTLLDPVLMRLVDVVLSFPPLLLFILVVTGVGTSNLMIILTIAVILAPGIARIVYSATREASVRGYTEAAVTRGENTPSILVREILPNIMGPLIANLGLTITFAVLLVAGATYLGFGVQPPEANWALMISQNRDILAINVWSTVVPAVMIALLTIGANMVGDAVSQTLGRSGRRTQAPTGVVEELAIPAEMI